MALASLPSQPRETSRHRYIVSPDVYLYFCTLLRDLIPQIHLVIQRTFICYFFTVSGTKNTEVNKTDQNSALKELTYMPIWPTAL